MCKKYFDVKITILNDKLNTKYYRYKYDIKIITLKNNSSFNGIWRKFENNFFSFEEFGKTRKNCTNQKTS